MQQNLRKIEKLYTNSLKKYGVSPKSVGWKNAISHQLRFRKLLTVIDENETEISINDLGCGWGGLYDYIINKTKFKISCYYGYDISKDMLNAAKKHIQFKNAHFYKSDHILYSADYSFVSGNFNVKFNESNKKWLEYVKSVIINLNKKSKKGFAFNALTTYVDYKEKHLYYADPLYFFDFCKRIISKKVSLLHDYNLWEWTIIVKKGK